MPYMTPAMTWTTSPGITATTIWSTWMKSMTSTPHTPSDSTQLSNACCFSGSFSMSMSGMHSHMTSAQIATIATIAAASRSIFFFLGIVARSRCFMCRLNRLSA